MKIRTHLLLLFYSFRPDFRQKVIFESRANDFKEKSRAHFQAHTHFTIGFVHERCSDFIRKLFPIVLQSSADLSAYSSVYLEPLNCLFISLLSTKQLKFRRNCSWTCYVGRPKRLKVDSKRMNVLFTIDFDSILL